MTATKTMNGETIRVNGDGTCFDCAAWIAGDDGVLGLCNNERSTHFAHMIAFKHRRAGGP